MTRSKEGRAAKIVNAKRDDRRGLADKIPFPTGSIAKRSNIFKNMLEYKGMLLKNYHENVVLGSRPADSPLLSVHLVFRESWGGGVKEGDRFSFSIQVLLIHLSDAQNSKNFKEYFLQA